VLCTLGDLGLFNDSIGVELLALVVERVPNENLNRPSGTSHDVLRRVCMNTPIKLGS